MHDRIKIATGDITRLQVGAVVTAANSELRGGGGVDGAIHRAAGPELLVASRALAPCPAGSARITPGFELSAKYVIHAVGPIYDEVQNADEVLASAYRTSLMLAAENDVEEIAFPCISTGIYGFPRESASEIAVETARTWLRENAKPTTVIFCCFLEEDVELYRQILSDHN